MDINFRGIKQSECINIQTSLRKKINMNNTFNINNIKTIVGLDSAYWKEGNKEKAVCCAVVIDIDSHEVIETEHVFGEVTFPYIPGCLSFREIPLILKVMDKLKSSVDIVMLDGNGMLHPRHMGLATHISFYINKPTIGVAKTYYKVNQRDFDMPKNIAGAYSNIEVDNLVVARALRTHENVKPVFVSVGNNIDLDTSTDITLRVVGKESHIPIPTRLADIETHLWRNTYAK